MEGFGLRNYSGFGPFKANKLTNLSFDPSIKKSRWICPKWLNPNHNSCGMTYHNNLNRWGKNTVDIVGKGQEFIAKPKDIEGCKKWLISIFNNNKYNSVF